MRVEYGLNRFLAKNRAGKKAEMSFFSDLIARDNHRHQQSYGRCFSSLTETFIPSPFFLFFILFYFFLFS